jgi:hypothetical protein
MMPQKFGRYDNILLPIDARADLDQLRDERDHYRREYSDHWWSQNVDVVLCPPFPGTASRHDTAKYWGCVMLSCFIPDI